MEYVDGRLLSDLIPNDGLPLERVFRYGVQTADALAHAHEQRIIHRDLKSPNIAITKDGRVKILDFGLAQRVRDHAADATTIVTVGSDRTSFSGTLAYMAPESLSGAQPDARGDIWALGVVLYEMAVGTNPFFGGNGPALMASILRDPPAAVPTRVPESLDTIIGRCLMKEPGERYQSAAEVRAALEPLESLRFTGRRRPVKRAKTSAPRRSTRRSKRAGGIAVLPLANRSPDPDQEFFVDGLTDALIAELSKIRALKVISRTSTVRFRDSDKSLPAIARELGVETIVEGSVIRIGDKVRIVAELINAKSDEHLWANTYDRDVDNILSLQSEVARAIADQIKVAVTPEEQARLRGGPSIDPEVQEAYLKGRFHWNRRTPDDLCKALEFFQHAATKDPGCALGHIGVSDTYTLLGVYGLSPPHVAYPPAKSAAIRAIELDDSSSGAHAALGMVSHVYDWDWTAAEREYQRALELNPSDALAHFRYATLLGAMRRHEEAMLKIRRAQTLDPLALGIITYAGLVLRWAGESDRSLAELEKAMALDPRFPEAPFQAACTYLAKGQPIDALSMFEKGRALTGPTPRVLSFMAFAEGRAGHRAEGVSLLDELTAQAAAHDVSPGYLALANLGLDRLDEAFDWFDKAYDYRDQIVLPTLHVEPYCDFVHADPRFQSLVGRLNYPS